MLRHGRVLWLFPAAALSLLLFAAIAAALGSTLGIHDRLGAVFLIACAVWIVVTALGWPILVYVLWRRNRLTQSEKSLRESAAFVPSLACWVVAGLLCAAVAFAVR